MTDQEPKSSKAQERAARGEDPTTSVSKDRMEIWRPGYSGEIADTAGEETRERSQTTGAKPAVRPRIKPVSKDPGGN